MASSAKHFGCDIINIESDEEHDGDGLGGTVAEEEVSRSGFLPDGEAMSFSDCFPAFNQREIGDFCPCFPFVESNSDSGSVSMDSGPDPRSCFIDFFNRESHEVDRGGEFCLTSNQRESTSGDFSLQSFYGMDVDIDLGLGIGSGLVRGEIDGDSDNGNKESDSGRVEVGTGLTPFWDYFLGEEEADEELEWEDLQNAINWFLLDDSFDDGVMDVDFLDVYLDSSIENLFVNDAVLFDNNDDVIMASPPASKRVVEDLPAVEITSEELRDGNIVCAICKDEVLVEEKVKRLPCRHYYHGECIIPWLGLRNTCPVCRYELPTDDLDYERNRRTQRRGLVTDLMSE
ncbi:unnamed protein product [Arabis nemorensis]|uniref:RING-type E3 ubiquitin transferase n=1 Tax=Arabis nemorensis TaxID=586526 RepID=A0A565CLQ6_9BRAS|nr:unnamed protein product [Arabis nemorensis]